MHSAFDRSRFAVFAILAVAACGGASSTNTAASSPSACKRLVGRWKVTQSHPSPLGDARHPLLGAEIHFTYDGRERTIEHVGGPELARTRDVQAYRSDPLAANQCAIEAENGSEGRSTATFEGANRVRIEGPAKTIVLERLR